MSGQPLPSPDLPAGHRLGSGRSSSRWATTSPDRRSSSAAAAPARHVVRTVQHRRERARALPRRSNGRAVPGGSPRRRRVTRVARASRCRPTGGDSAAARRWPATATSGRPRRRPRQAPGARQPVAFRLRARRGVDRSLRPARPGESAGGARRRLQSPLVFDLPPGSTNGTVLQESAELAKIGESAGRRRRPDRVRERPRCSSRIAFRPTPGAPSRAPGPADDGAAGHGHRAQTE